MHWMTSGTFIHALRVSYTASSAATTAAHSAITHSSSHACTTTSASICSVHGKTTIAIVTIAIIIVTSIIAAISTVVIFNTCCTQTQTPQCYIRTFPLQTTVKVKARIHFAVIGETSLWATTNENKMTTSFQWSWTSQNANKICLCCYKK